MTLGSISTLISLTLGLLGFLSGAILWYRGSIEKRYAAERDFGHLKRNQEQMSQALGIIDDELADLIKLANANLELSRELSRRYEAIDRTLIELNGAINWTSRNPSDRE